MIHKSFFGERGTMDELHELLRPTWGSEQWIFEGWERINTDEKTQIKKRIKKLFKEGLPFELKHNKLLYIYTFSLLAQLEVLAIQVPLKFESHMANPQDKERMHVQLLDEIFHGLVFTKILYLLCAPHSLPPAYNENVEMICNFIRNEECPKIGIMLLNLIGEGWIEEIFYSLKRQNIAPEVFQTILDDEHRHVCEADLYRSIGMPDMQQVKVKLEFLEEQLLGNLFLQYKYVYSVSSLLGVDGSIDFLQSLNKKHMAQLEKIHLVPSSKWQFFMQTLHNILPKVNEYSESNYEVAMTPMRKVLMTQWDNPSDPTMVGEFKLNISCLDFFNKKYPPQTLTLLMLQTTSAMLKEQDSFRSFLSHKRLYQSKEAYVGLIIKLPECADHIGTIVFENCHNLSMAQLHQRILFILEMMVYCYKKREELEKAHPHLALFSEKMLDDFSNDFYGYPIPGSPLVSLSNIGAYGYSNAAAPLRNNEAIRFTLTEVERKPVWNKARQEFVAEDILPVSISADHRVFDGNLPVPKIMMQLFDQMFKKMLVDNAEATKEHKNPENPELIKTIEQIIQNNLELAYKTLNVLQTLWPDFMALEEVFTLEVAQELATFSTS